MTTAFSTFTNGGSTFGGSSSFLTSLVSLALALPKVKVPAGFNFAGAAVAVVAVVDEITSLLFPFVRASLASAGRAGAFALPLPSFSRAQAACVAHQDEQSRMHKISHTFTSSPTTRPTMAANSGPPSTSAFRTRS
jgi:hypothetical protein